MAVHEFIEAGEGQGEVRAALCPGQGVDLVDDHGLHPAQRLSRRGGEEQEQRLRGRDEDVGGSGGLSAAFGRVGVPGTDSDANIGNLQPHAGGSLTDADERRTQVAFDIRGERLERGDIQNAATILSIRDIRGQTAIDGREEGRERLAGTGGGHDERVIPGRDRLPRLSLGRSGRGEGIGEPCPGCGRDMRDRFGHAHILPGRTRLGAGASVIHYPRWRR